ncbi:MAG: septum formation initiator family protein [Lachnospiraceae bacterium]|nr:septum formation initiator family protein [Lachnospiraceae bacterium]
MNTSSRRVRSTGSSGTKTADRRETRSRTENRKTAASGITAASGSRSRVSGKAAVSDGRNRTSGSRSRVSGKAAVSDGRNRTSARTRVNKKTAGKNRAGGRSSGRGILQQGTEQNRMSMFMAVLVVVLLMIVVGINGVSLVRRLRENESRIQTLRQEIRAEEERAEDIEEYRRYTKTDAYIEEIAREKLGLIYEGETVFKEDK